MREKFILAGIIAVIVCCFTIISILSPPAEKSIQNENISANDKFLSIDVVKMHNSAADCWTVIDNNVYDITKYISVHPGGPVIAKSCGTDGTTLFNTKDGSGRQHSEFAQGLLKDYLIGELNSALFGASEDNLINESNILNESNLPQERLLNETVQLPGQDLGYDLADVSLHNSLSSCWLVITDNVYDVTGFISAHPGGTSVIIKYCGKDATNAFNTKDGSGSPHSNFAKSMLEDYLIGPLIIKPTDPPIATIISPTENQAFDSGTTQVTLSVSTNKDSNCRWDTTDKSYGSMRYAFSTTGKKIHSAKLTGLSDGNSYKRYVRCVDLAENEMLSGASVSFLVSLPLPDSGGYTIEEISLHNSLSSCWLVINDKVYDVTGFISAHPGGTSVIKKFCGKESTNAFNTKDGSGSSHSNYAEGLLDNYLIGTLLAMPTDPPIATIVSPTANQIFSSGTTQATLSISTNKDATCKWDTADKTYLSMANAFSITGAKSHSHTITGLSDGNSYIRYVRCRDLNNNEMLSSEAVSFSVGSPVPPAPSSGYTAADVATHNSAGSCWLIITSKVYDVTSYIYVHPGGPNRILSYCGKEASTAFNTRGGSGTHSNNAKNILAGFYLADLDTSATGGTNTTGDSGSSIPTIEEVIEENYPGATIQEINEEDNGNIEVQIKYNGEDETVWLDSDHNII